MTDEEAHNAYVTGTKVKLGWAVSTGVIIMIGYKRDGKTIITAVEDERGTVRVASPAEMELANPLDWDPHGSQTN